MSIKVYKPTTQTRRHTVLVNYRKDLTKRKPEKSLTLRLKNRAGRSYGKVSVRHKGGRSGRQYRVIDFKRSKRDIPARVESIEYDPYRSAFIALVLYKDGERAYIIHPEGLRVGDEIVAGDEVETKVGNATMVKNIPSGTFVHNIELHPGKGAKMVRAAGQAAQIQGGDKGYIQLKMPSGEIRLVLGENYATIGRVGNVDHSNVKYGKAGRKRKMGIRPTVRGMAMAGNQHPHGGGESKGVMGGRAAKGGKDIWGHRKGVKTRKKKKRTNRYIIQRKISKSRPKVKKINK